MGVLTAEQDVTRTLEAVQVKEVEVVAKRKQQAVASLTRMNLGTLPQLLNNLSLKLNSPLNVDGQTPANTSVLVANTTSEAKNTSLLDGSATNSSTGDQNSTIASFATLQTEVGEDLEAGKQTLIGLADNPAQLSAQTQTALDSLEKSVDRLTAALPQLTVKDEDERGAGRVLLANLESIKSEASRALASLAAAGGQQITSSNGLPASNATLLPAQSVANNNGVAAVDVISSTTAAAAAAVASSSSTSAAAAAVTPTSPPVPLAASSPPQ